MALKLEAEARGGDYSLLKMAINHLATLILPVFFEDALRIRKLNSLISPSPGYFRRQTLAQEGKPELPLLSLSISNYDRAEGWNHRAHQLNARIGNRSANGRYYHAGAISPIQVSLTATFVTDDVDQQLAVVEQLFGGTDALQFTTILKNDAGFEALALDHSVYLDFNFAPDAQDDTESGDYHNLQFGVQLKTWVGKLVRVPSVLEVHREGYAITEFSDQSLILEQLSSVSYKGKNPDEPNSRSRT